MVCSLNFKIFERSHLAIVFGDPKYIMNGSNSKDDHEGDGDARVEC